MLHFHVMRMPKVCNVINFGSLLLYVKKKKIEKKNDSGGFLRGGGGGGAFKHLHRQNEKY